MDQWTFDKDLYIKYDDTGSRMLFPEQEYGFEDNPIQKLFERVEDIDVQDEEE